MLSDMRQEVISNIAQASITINGKELNHFIVRDAGMPVERFMRSTPIIMSAWLNSMSLQGVGYNMWSRNHAL